jgi:hypothetical protein
MRRLFRVSALAAALSLVLPVPAAAQVFLGPTRFAGAPVTGSEPGISLPLPGATEAEYAAALLWNLRAGLNVAALQCHGSPFLDTTANYNAMLNNHFGELRPAYATLQGYFTRTQGAKGNKAFDDYNTKTYNGFSTLYAQQGFCQTSASIGRDVIFAPRGGLAAVAQARMRELRNSLVPIGDTALATKLFYIPLPQVANFSPKCFKRDGTIKPSCLKD